MDSIWTWSLVAVAFVSMALSYRVPRAWWWIGAGGLSFFVTTLFLDYSGRPDLHPFLSFACDALVCLCIFRWYQSEWELGVFLAFMCSCFASILRIGGFIPDQWVYASLQEMANLAALACIGGTGIVSMIGKDVHSPFHRYAMRLHSPRENAGRHDPSN